MDSLYYIIIGLYTLVIVYILVYCLMQFHLLVHYKRFHKHNAQEYSATDREIESVLPFVTVQLPIYNEYYVIGRLIDAVCKFDYPKDRFEIHILDDSTDETVQLVAEKVEAYKKQGFLIEQIQRVKRHGYKAGALRDGMSKAKGEFIAIFDADFLPNTDFLQKTLPYFQNAKVGVVQTRWEHINQGYSLLTMLQAIQLNVHFTVEQTGRVAANYMAQFNGTAGIWRRKTIDDAGGWKSDTLTEDLDLSIRAQLKGYKIKYLEHIGSPAELPAEMNGLKSQQYRWMKGGAETARKMIPSIWQSKSLPLGKKIHSTIHLLASSVFVFVFSLGVLSVPLLVALDKLMLRSDIFSLFIVSTLSIVIVYYAVNVTNVHTRIHENRIVSFFKFLYLFPMFLAMSMGLSLHNTVAVLQGWLGKKSAFVRTPKFNIQNLKDSFRVRKYFSGKLNWTTAVEGLLCLYFMGAIVLGFYIDDTSLILFHILLALGYGTIFYFSVKHLNYKQ